MSKLSPLVRGYLRKVCALIAALPAPSSSHHPHVYHYRIVDEAHSYRSAIDAL